MKKGSSLMNVEVIILWHYYQGNKKVDSDICEFTGTFEELENLIEKKRMQNSEDSRIAILQQIVLINWKI